MLSKTLNTKLHKLLNERNYPKVREVIEVNLEKWSKKNTKTSLLRIAELYGFLIDLGCESGNERDLLRAVRFLENAESNIGELLNKQSFYYNLANAKHGLARIYLFKNRGVPKLKAVSEKLQSPINLYWLAFKHLDEDDSKDLKHQILINLAISLCDSGRIVESLQFLDMVLAEKPEYPQALISRAETLNFLSKVTNCSYTVSLFYEIFKSYNSGINTGRLPQGLLNRYVADCKGVVKKIESYGFDVNNLSSEDIESKREFNNHSAYRKFCLNNFLSLNEHAIYCGCVSAEKDNLTIGVQHAKFKGKMVPRLELLLNRMKSEFSLARYLFYMSGEPDDVEETTLYSELLDGEVINTKTEMLRTSFRICYGILDKIAHGICKYYGLSEKGDTIYFERFWNPGKSSDRWEKLDELKNMHLSALYSIACDLNTKTGELKHFKKWRNLMEHNILIIRENGASEPDILQLYKDEDFITTVNLREFKEKTLHLLQLTRAAIITFVYCIRLETIEELDDNGTAFVVNFK